MCQPGAYGSIVEIQAASDAMGIRVVILDEVGRLIEKVTPAANPPQGVLRPGHNFEGIVLRLDRNHDEWAKVRYEFFQRIPRKVKCMIR